MERNCNATFEKKIPQKFKKPQVVSRNLNLPLFIASRVSLRKNQPNYLGKYIKKKDEFFSKDCKVEKEGDFKTNQQLKHKLGFDKAVKGICLTSTFGTEQYKRNETLKFAHDRRLLKKPEDIKPKLSTYKQLEQFKERFPKPKLIDWPIYNPDLNVIYGGILGIDVRQQKPTNRSMVNDIHGCYRDPDQANAATYYPKHHELSYKMRPIKEKRIILHHHFLPHSNIPLKPMAYYERQTIFYPGPDRYENRYARCCPCSTNAKKIFMPEIDDMILFEKRKKLHRLPYKVYKRDKYCSPKWSHVHGHGFRHLFKNIPPLPEHTNFSEKRAGSQKSVVHMYPDSRYIRAITHPKREIGFSFNHYIRPPPKFFYNSTAKRFLKKTNIFNRRVMFGSTIKRFSTLRYNFSQVRLELMRRVNDARSSTRLAAKKYVTQKPLTLYDVPERLMPTFKRDKWKKNFKFLRLPPPKILVSNSDIRGTRDLDEEHFYGKDVDVLKYIQKGVNIPKDLLSPEYGLVKDTTKIKF